MVENQTDDSFPIWKTVELGTDPGIVALYKPFLTEGWHEEHADNFISALVATLSRRKKRVDLVLAGASQLTGNSGESNLAEVFTGAQRRGLKKCSPEAALQLCRRFHREFMDPEFWVEIIRKFGVFSYIHLGMEPLRFDKSSDVFFIAYNHYKGPCLSICNLNPEEPLSEIPVVGNQPFIFAKANAKRVVA